MERWSLTLLLTNNGGLHQPLPWSMDEVPDYSNFSCTSTLRPPHTHTHRQIILIGIKSQITFQTYRTTILPHPCKPTVDIFLVHSQSTSLWDNRLLKQLWQFDGEIVFYCFFTFHVCYTSERGYRPYCTSYLFPPSVMFCLNSLAVDLPEVKCFSNWFVWAMWTLTIFSFCTFTANALWGCFILISYGVSWIMKISIYSNPF